jgi:hypothetical protein
VSRAEIAPTVSTSSLLPSIATAKKIRSSSASSNAGGRRRTSWPVDARVGSPGVAVSPATAGRFQAISPLAVVSTPLAFVAT